MMLLALVLAATPLELAPVTSNALDEPRAGRAMVVISAENISYTTMKDSTPKQLAALANFKAASIPWSKLETALPEKSDERFFSSAIDGWAQLHLDRRTPMSLVLELYASVMRVESCVALVVKTPTAERAIDIFPTAEKTEDVIVKVGAKLEIVGASQNPIKVAATASALQKALMAFNLSVGKKRAQETWSLGGWACMDAKGVKLPAESCWHPRVLLVVDPKQKWGDFAPLLAVAFEEVRDVQLANLN
ncbi:MAG: hypothetical protein QM817_29125 [Archangium sp.]